MANKIASKTYCNTLKANSFTSDMNKMPTKNEIEAVGLTVTGTYATNQLVVETDVSYTTPIIMPNLIVVGLGGNILAKTSLP
ncbi:hypothetical protein [Dysgonomonas termitidis]|uniref:Uncharacterized protein n=1 Tax=Dysgonomonas termitidis TaxID=1516126 RepID=A0ABV9KWD7_9BACT